MINILNSEEFINRLKERRGSVSYRAMFSTWFNGIVTEPSLMLLPIDDHLVHRGDGVFEAIRFFSHNLYLGTEHLDRLIRSARAISLPLPCSTEKILEVISEVITAANLIEGIIRIFVGRGVGDFSANPYSPLKSEMYIIATPLNRLPEELYEKGAKLILSDVPFKPFPYSTIKSCNYLQNVMMVKDAKDSKAHFAVNISPDGWIGEGAVENIALVTRDNQLLAPPFDYTLPGTTLVRLFELSRNNQQYLGLSGISQRRLSVHDLTEAQEVLMIGTTTEVCPVTTFNEKPIGDGYVGLIAKNLRRLLLADIEESRTLKE
jgi:branched-subunit amino acid aminotransferase/4-amino-4-deoxychorismate lyase